VIGARGYQSGAAPPHSIGAPIRWGLGPDEADLAVEAGAPCAGLGESVGDGVLRAGLQCGVVMCPGRHTSRNERRPPHSVMLSSEGRPPDLVILREVRRPKDLRHTYLSSGCTREVLRFAQDDRCRWPSPFGLRLTSTLFQRSAPPGRRFVFERASLFALVRGRPAGLRTSRTGRVWRGRRRPPRVAEDKAAAPADWGQACRTPNRTRFSEDGPCRDGSGSVALRATPKRRRVAALP